MDFGLVDFVCSCQLIGQVMNEKLCKLDCNFVFTSFLLKLHEFSELLYRGIHPFQTMVK